MPDYLSWIASYACNRKPNEKREIGTPRTGCYLCLQEQRENKYTDISHHRKQELDTCVHRRSRTAVKTALLLSACWDVERSTMSLRHCAGMLAVLLALSGTVCAQVAPCNKSQVRKQSCLEYLDVADFKHTRTRHDVMLTERYAAMQPATSLANCPPAMHARALAGPTHVTLWGRPPTNATPADEQPQTLSRSTALSSTRSSGQIEFA
jgi:hypothetical protein